MATVLMADYGADPLWRQYETPKASREIALDLDSRPLSARLKHELRAWAARFAALSKSGYEWPSVEDERTWVADGRALLEPFAKSLAPTTRSATSQTAPDGDAPPPAAA